MRVLASTDVCGPVTRRIIVFLVPAPPASTVNTVYSISKPSDLWEMGFTGSVPVYTFTTLAEGSSFLVDALRARQKLL